MMIILLDGKKWQYLKNYIKNIQNNQAPPDRKTKDICDIPV